MHDQNDYLDLLLESLGEESTCFEGFDKNLANRWDEDSEEGLTYKKYKGLSYDKDGEPIYNSDEDAEEFRFSTDGEDIDVKDDSDTLIKKANNRLKSKLDALKRKRDIEDSVKTAEEADKQSRFDDIDALAWAVARDKRKEEEAKIASDKLQSTHYDDINIKVDDDLIAEYKDKYADDWENVGKKLDVEQAGKLKLQEELMGRPENNKERDERIATYFAKQDYLKDSKNSNFSDINPSTYIDAMGSSDDVKITDHNFVESKRKNDKLTAYKELFGDDKFFSDLSKDANADLSFFDYIADKVGDESKISDTLKRGIYGIAKTSSKFKHIANPIWEKILNEMANRVKRLNEKYPAPLEVINETTGNTICVKGPDGDYYRYLSPDLIDVSDEASARRASSAKSHQAILFASDDSLRKKVKNKVFKAKDNFYSTLEDLGSTLTADTEAQYIKRNKEGKYTKVGSMAVVPRFVWPEGRYREDAKNAAIFKGELIRLLDPKEENYDESDTNKYNKDVEEARKKLENPDEFYTQDEKESFKSTLKKSKPELGDKTTGGLPSLAKARRAGGFNALPISYRKMMIENFIPNYKRFAAIIGLYQRVYNSIYKKYQQVDDRTQQDKNLLEDQEKQAKTLYKPENLEKERLENDKLRNKRNWDYNPDLVNKAQAYINWKKSGKSHEDYLKRLNDIEDHKESVKRKVLINKNKNKQSGDIEKGVLRNKNTNKEHTSTDLKRQLPWNKQMTLGDLLK